MLFAKQIAVIIRWLLLESHVTIVPYRHVSSSHGLGGAPATLTWKVSCQCSHRAFRTSSAAFAGGKWRLEQGMSATGNEYGPLVDIPDWSYADGRPAPLGRREMARREKRRDCAKRVVELIDEMKFAKKNYARKQKLVEEERNQLISRKLKPRTS